MPRQQGWFAVLVGLAIVAFIVCTNYPLQLGLDLRGGSLLTVEIQPAGEITKIGAQEVEAVKKILERRVNGLGVSESTLQTIGTDQLQLQLPGEQDPGRAAKVLGETALLEFRIENTNSKDRVKLLRKLRSQLNNYISYTKIIEKKTNVNNDPILDISKIKQDLNLSLSKNGFGSPNDISQFEIALKQINSEIVDSFVDVNLTGKDLISAGRQQEQNSSNWEVTLSFNKSGGQKFAEITREIAGTGRLLSIILDGRSISEAVVGEQFKSAGITGGSATISGNFSAESARDLEVQLRGGSLPLPVKIIEEKRIGPSLGVENIKRSLSSALLGLLLVSTFIIALYRLAGFVSVISLGFYALLNISVYTLLPVTLTLPGIAGFILSIGMAVDANILIFERLKDELRRGNTLIRSIENGFQQAFSSIIDGHITTLISCAALFYLGTGFVKGFAATLGIGVVLSLFTSLICTKKILKFLMGYQSLRKIKNFIPLNQITSSVN